MTVQFKAFELYLDLFLEDFFFISKLSLLEFNFNKNQRK